jgi:hypothetical protein
MTVLAQSRPTRTSASIDAGDPARGSCSRRGSWWGWLRDNAEDPLGWCDSQAQFEFTLDLILDGLALHQHAPAN